MTYEKWRRRLANANDPQFIPIEHIDALLASGEAQFWASDDAAMVTQIVHWPGGAVSVRAIAAAGKKADITGALKDAVLAWGAAVGCTHAFVEGRDGWRNELPDFEHYQTILVKELA